MIGLFSLSQLGRPMSDRAAEVLRLIRTMGKGRRSRRFFSGQVPPRADRDLFFQDSKLVSGWGFAPAMNSRVRRTSTHS